MGFFSTLPPANLGLIILFNWIVLLGANKLEDLDDLEDLEDLDDLDESDYLVDIELEDDLDDFLLAFSLLILSIT